MPAGLLNLVASGHVEDSIPNLHAVGPRRLPVGSHLAASAEAGGPSVASAAEAARQAARAAHSAVRTAYIPTQLDATSSPSSASSAFPEAFISTLRPASRISADAASSFLSSPADLRATKPDATSFFGLFDDKFSNKAWRTRHNYSLDRGIKFMVVDKGAKDGQTNSLIVDTDLFDDEKFGCHESRAKGLGTTFKFMKKLNQEYGKEWWWHPEFTFGAVVGRVGIKLTDQTTGEVKWDAIYELSEGSNYLMKDDKPIGGNHPFFQPDWCPAPGGPYAHRFELKVTNLGELPGPELENIATMYFNVYNSQHLANTYAYENEAGADTA